MSPRVWFVTGASTGIGRAAAEYLLQQGDIVVATLRKPEVLADLQAKYSGNKLLVLKLDVSKPQDVSSAFFKAKEAFGRIDIVFNNAGYGVMGEIEAVDEDVARTMFDTNFWGSTNVSKEAVKFFRDVNKPVGGRLIINSSYSSIKPVITFGHYSASKAALEAVHEILASELDPEWNIKVTIIEPGGFRTEGVKSAMGFQAPPPPQYQKATLPSVVLRSHYSPDIKLLGDANKLAARLDELSKVEDPPLRLPLGKDAVEAVRAQIAKHTAEFDKYESWSENLTFDD